MDAVRKVARQDAFTLEMDEGESWTIPGTNSSLRFIMDEECGPFALIHSRGNPDDAVPPHFHKEAVDTWLVLQGALKVWAGTTGRVLSAGDFAFVPPGNVHSYQVIEPHTEFIGVIHPSQWVSFFRAIGERNNALGPYPSNDSRPFPVERFMKAIKDGHDVVPQFGHKFTEMLHDWSDSEVPDTPKPYFLKAHRGVRYALGGQTCAPLCTFGASGDKFSMNYLEVHKSMQQNKLLNSITFRDACQVVYVQTGSLKVKISGEDHLLQTGDSAYVPPGAAFSIQPASHFARALVCSSGLGLESLFKVGKSIQGVIGSEDAEVDSSTIEALKAAAEKANIEIELAHSNGH